MKQKWRKNKEYKGRRTEVLFVQRNKRRNSCTVILLFLLDYLHYYFSLYICSIGRYYTENMLSFTLNIMLTDSLLLTNTTNRMLTILIANLLTLGIIRTVDIFTLGTVRLIGFGFLSKTEFDQLIHSFQGLTQWAESSFQDRMESHRMNWLG